MRKFLSAPMEPHLQRWGGIYPHNQMQLQLIPLPLSAANNHHPSTRAHQHQRVAIKTRPTFTPTSSSILVHCYLHFFPFSHIFCSIFTRRNGYVILLHLDGGWGAGAWLGCAWRCFALSPNSLLFERYPAVWGCWLLCSGPIDCDIIDLGHIHDS